MTDMNDVNALFNRMIRNSPELKSLFTQSAGYSYYTRKGSKDEYFYTHEKVNHKGHSRYVAGIYRYLKTKKQLKLVRRSGFAHKHDAMARALKWSEEEK